MHRVFLVFLVFVAASETLAQQVMYIDLPASVRSSSPKATAMVRDAAPVSTPASPAPPGDPHAVLLPAGCAGMKLVGGIVPSLGNASGPGYTSHGDAIGLTIVFTDPTFTNPAVMPCPKAPQASCR